MSQETAARFFKAVQKDQGLQDRLKATNDPDTFIKIAEHRGYHFTVEELSAALGNLSDDEVSAVVNPGIGPRRRIVPR